MPRRTSQSRTRSRPYQPPTPSGNGSSPVALLRARYRSRCWSMPKSRASWFSGSSAGLRAAAELLMTRCGGWLMPPNRDYQPISAAGTCILGVIVAMLRRL
jgi:hypothetical protein